MVGQRSLTLPGVKDEDQDCSRDRPPGAYREKAAAADAPGARGAGGLHPAVDRVPRAWGRAPGDRTRAADAVRAGRAPGRPDSRGGGGRGMSVPPQLAVLLDREIVAHLEPVPGSRLYRLRYVSAW